MASTTGTVSCVQVADDFCFFALRQSAGTTPEAFVLWFFTAEATAHERILQSIEVSMLREAQTTGIPVTVVHSDTSAQVLSLQVGTL